MLLDNKTAVIYGGGGSIGGAVPRTFGREGARMFLAGRTLAALEDVAEAIRATGGRPKPPRSTHPTSRRSTATPTRPRRRPVGSTSPSTSVTHPKPTECRSPR